MNNPLSVYLGTSDGCSVGSVCTPCYDPFDATPTGACTMKLEGGGQDKPARPSPAPYAACPQGDAGVAPHPGGGVCVPSTMIKVLGDPANALYNPLILRMRQDSCRDGELCVAREKAASPWSCATPCKTSNLLMQLGFPNGACVPAFVVYDTNGMAGVTVFEGTAQPNPPSGCAADELCYPCGDPLTGGAPSGACY